MTKPSSGLRRLLPPATRETLLRHRNRLHALFLPDPYRTVLPFTMVGLERLRSLDRLVHRIDEDRVGGDVVECGVYNGGSGALLARHACRSPFERHSWLLDSFAGMPEPGAEDGADATQFTPLCEGTMDNVRRVLRRAGVPPEKVSIVPGWFEETIPGLPVERIALLHLDANWYDSTRIALDHLYDKVSPGGFVVLDDYGYWDGCRRAVTDFFEERGLSWEIRSVDGIGAYFRKDG